MIKQIGPYRIERILGSGGMGVVYKGRHEILGRDAAIKAVRRAAHQRLRERLLAEARAQAHLRHPNIVAVYDPIVGENDELFIPMEYVDGETLSAMLHRSPGSRLTPAAASPIFEQLLDALEYVHRREVVHRDLKPSNVMISRAGEVKLTDFGIALLAGEARLTTHGVAGTPAYMSPEQLEGKRDLDGRSDLYSAALVFYRILVGCPAFEAKDYLPMVHDRLAGPRPIAAIAPHLPPGLCDALAKATQYDREDRFRSAADFRLALCDGAAGFVGRVPRAEDDQSTVELPKGEPIELLPAPAIAERAAGSWRTPAAVACAAAILAGGAYVLLDEQIVDDELPVVTASIAHPEPLPPTPIIDERNRVPPTTPAEEKQRPPLTTTEAPQIPAPSVTETSMNAPEQDAGRESEAEIERVRRRAISALGLQLEEGFRVVRAHFDAERFDEGREELKRMVRMAQLYPTDLWQELEAIEQMRAEESWLRRIAEVETKLREEAWIEAESLAKGIAADGDAPEAVARRAREIEQQVKEVRANGFREMQPGRTTNTIVRKPSSPPGRDL